MKPPLKEIDLFSNGYHILLIPKNTYKTKKIHLSSVTVRLILLGLLLIVPILIGFSVTIMNYQEKLASLKQNMSEDQAFDDQKEMLTSRVSSLERQLTRSEQTVNDLKKLLDVDSNTMTMGLGPIEVKGNSKHFKKNQSTTSLSLKHFLEHGDEFNLQSVNSKMNELNDRIDSLHTELEAIYEINADRVKFVNSIPNRLPVNGWVTSAFGFRNSPTGGGYKMHYGLDIASPVGTVIRAPADGRVSLSEYKGGYGKAIILDHGYGISTLYGHASALYVKEGEFVKKGDKIAAVGSSGSSTGPHLHYEVHVDGIPSDPMMYVGK